MERKLVSKIQYKNFETGEFSETKERTYSETVRLIEDFPWKEQRENIVIGLTNPSVTIEGLSGDFLKLAVFFNRKYVLRYFNNKQELYTKSFVDIRDSYSYIGAFYEEDVFTPAGFKKETTWLQHNLNYFISKDFRYEVTPKSLWKFLISTSGVNFLIFVSTVVLFFFTRIKHHDYILLYVLCLFYFFLMGGGVNLVLFFNYYQYAKDKVLIMSKGNEIFFYGDKEHTIQYNKKDIVQYTLIKTRSGGKNPISDFAIIKIEFENGDVVRFPSLLIGYRALEEKLYQCKKVERYRFPFLQE